MNSSMTDQQQNQDHPAPLHKIKIVRERGTKMVMIERLRGSYPNIIFYTARAYEKIILSHVQTHGNRINYKGVFMGDIAYRKEGKEEKNHKEAYELINELFPELVGHGLRNEGYAKFNDEMAGPTICEFMLQSQ